jgi:iron complex outermembrane recepter protein
VTQLGDCMQDKLRTIALGVLGASLMMTGAAGAQTTLPGVTVESNQPRQGGGGGGSAQVAAPAPEPVAAEAPAEGGNPANAIDGYVAESTSTGTKTNTPLREIPQSVSVVTRDQIEDRGAQTLNDTIGYSAGVAPSPFGLDTRFDQFMIRGFDQNTTGVYRDGLRLPTVSFTGFRIEPYGVDHIDIMRGPTSTLYGLNNPGGLVNVVSKMPTEAAFGEIWAALGTDNYKATGFDIGGPVANGKVLYRVTGMVSDADTQVDFVENDRFYIAPAITFKPSEATTFTILANYQKDKTGDTFQLLPAEDVLNGTIPRGTFLGEPDFSKLNGEQWGIGYQFEHRFSPAVAFRQNLRYDHASTDYQTIYPGSGAFDLTTFEPIPGLVFLNAQDADETVSLFQVDNQLEFKSRWGKVENTALVGADYSNFSGDFKLGFGGVALNDTFFQDPRNPSYGNYTLFDLAQFAAGVFSPGLPTVRNTTRKLETAGIYVQDQIKYDDHWVLTLGARKDWTTSEVEDHLGTGDTTRDDDAITGRVGLNYLFDNGLTPYVSYSTSFLPVPLVDPAGALLQPEESEQYEAGVKYQPKGFKSYVLASVFDLTKQNATSQDVLGNYFQTGEIQIRGIELEGVADFDNGWKLLAAYSHWDAEITKDSFGNAGNRPERVPENIASLWVDYTFRTGMFKGFGLGAGVRYVGETFGDNANAFAVPSYTLFDAAIRYQWEGWNVQLAVKNLLDEEYAATCGTTTVDPALPTYDYCSYGNGRTATVRVGYRW